MSPKPMAKKEFLIPEINVGLVGHVDTGKTTLTQALSGKWTDTHSEEIKRGITIRLGYADVTIRKCPKCNGKGTEVYTISEKCPIHKVPTTPERTISLVDAPGHESLMANVLSGAAIMDGALLLVAANESCPQPQTREHLAALDIVGVKNIIIVQNKIDAVDETQAKKNYNQIKTFIKGTIAEKAPIIPVSAQHLLNIDVLLSEIQKSIPTPKRDKNAELKAIIVRSFDINRPGTPIKNIKGGVLGGSIEKGILKVGEIVEIKPGIKINNKWTPITTQVTNIMQGLSDVKEGSPGGLLGIETTLDPSLTKSDGLAGNVLGRVGKLPPLYDVLSIKAVLMERIVGTQSVEKVEALKENEPLLLAVGAIRTTGIITEIKNTVKIKLKMPVCAELGDRVAISRWFGARWRLIGYGTIAG